MKICIICNENASKYTCPSCSIRYCSIPCYKIHQEKGHESVKVSDELSESELLKLSENGLAFKSLCKSIMESEDPRLQMYKTAKENSDFGSFLKEMTKTLENKI